VLPDLVSNTIEAVKLTSIASVVSFPQLLYSAEMARSLTQFEPCRSGGFDLCCDAVAVGPAAQPARAPRSQPLKGLSLMPRIVTVAAAQLGAIQKADTRQAVVARMTDLMDQAKARGADFIVYPELALTTFFPRWYYEDRAEADAWFEKEMPNAATRPLFQRAAGHGMGMSFGYAELTPDGRHFNTSILVDARGMIVGKYRKVHLPGHADYDHARAFQHLEKRYFEPGDLGFPVWRFMGGIFGMCICNDRRWPEVYRVMGLQGVEMVTLGFNTPSVNSQRSEEGPQKRIFHHKLSLQAGAYQNSTWVVAVAKAGVEDGHPLFGSSAIVDPDGEIVAETGTEGDEIIVHACDLDATRFGKETIFDFKRHRRIEHYGRITSQVGVEPPPEA
jgi:predicted amidohydrolase